MLYYPWSQLQNQSNSQRRQEFLQLCHKEVKRYNCISNDFLYDRLSELIKRQHFLSVVIDLAMAKDETYINGFNEKCYIVCRNLLNTYLHERNVSRLVNDTITVPVLENVSWYKPQTQLQFHKPQILGDMIYVLMHRKRKDEITCQEMCVVSIEWMRMQVLSYALQYHGTERSVSELLWDDIKIMKELDQQEHIEMILLVAVFGDEWPFICFARHFIHLSESQDFMFVYFRKCTLQCRERGSPQLWFHM